MRRYRTRTTAWPAVADLMTALAVFGLACTFFVASQNSDLKARIENLKAQPEGPARLDKPHSTIFCWPRNDPDNPRNSYITYDVTVQDGRFSFQDGRFSFEVHEDWDSVRISSSLMSVLLDNIPRDATKEQVTGFAHRVFRTINEEDYPSNCFLAVTINRGADGQDVLFLTKLRIWPFYRNG